MYSPRPSHWLSPKLKHQYHSPYLATGNSLILNIDPYGGLSSLIFDFDGNYLGDDDGVYNKTLIKDPAVETHLKSLKGLKSIDIECAVKNKSFS